uniref:FHOD1 N-terminal GTPase-binding domain-containing protein n=1 Tax=Ursus americanus TaxID=9643 RepID=A0A452QZW1_URSAM
LTDGEDRMGQGCIMATLACRVQFLDDTDPFNSTNFPEPSRPPLFTFREDLALGTQLAGVHRLLRAPHKLDDCTLQLSHNGAYLDLEATLAEQRDELEGFQDDAGNLAAGSPEEILGLTFSLRFLANLHLAMGPSDRCNLDNISAPYTSDGLWQDEKAGFICGKVSIEGSQTMLGGCTFDRWAPNSPQRGLYVFPRVLVRGDLPTLSFGM